MYVMRRLLLAILLVGIIGIMGVAGTIVIVNPAAPARARLLTYGDQVQLDDFGFTVLQSETTPRIGTQTAQGVFYVVTLKVSNHARRVSFRFDPATALVLDDAEQAHTPLPAARRAWFDAHGGNDPCARELLAGEACTTTLVYDLPADTHTPLFRMQFGGAFGELIDAMLYGNRAVRLK